MAGRRSLRGVRGLLGLLSLLVVALVLVPSGMPSWAADTATGPDTVRITHVERSDAGLRLLVSVPAAASAQPDDVTVTIGGQEAAARTVAAGSSDAVRRTAVLAIDTSNSMQGARFAAARDAARSFLTSVPDDVYVGIVTFDGTVEVALDPTRDRDEARGVIDGLTLGGGTRLYDGIAQAVDLSGTEGQRSLLVLSDGADSSNAKLDTATTAIEDGGVLVDVVTLDRARDDTVALDSLAAAGKGRVIPADAGAVAAAFTGEARTLASQLLVTAQVPASVTDAEATVEVTVPTASGELVASAFSTIRDADESAPRAAPLSAGNGLTLPAWAMYAGVGLLGLGLVVLVVLIVPRPARPMSAEERVASYATATTRQPVSSTRPDADQALTSAKNAAADLLKRNAGLEARIARRLDGAGSELKPAEWLLVHTAVVIASTLLGLLLGGILLGLIFLGLGVVLPWVYLGFKRARRRKAFNAALPDTLQLMSGSLSAGLSLAQSVDTIVREGMPPVADEFRRVLVETRLGVSLEDAMDGVAARFESKDFAWVVMAIKIQRQVGGNLAELLDTVAGTMREREYVRRQVAALAAEGKLSAWVLGLLPPLFLLYLLVANREYVIVLFTDPRGWLMLGGAALWLSIGVFWMSKLVKVEV